MAKNINNPNQEKNEKVGEAVSQTEEFFKKNGKKLSYTGVALILVAAIIVLVIQFYSKPMKAEAVSQTFTAEQYFRAEDYDKALNGDGNALGFAQIIDEYGAKAGKAVYLYAGICELQLGNAQEAISYLGKYRTKEPVMKGRALACIPCSRTMRQLSATISRLQRPRTISSLPHTCSRPVSSARSWDATTRLSPTTVSSRTNTRSPTRDMRLTSTFHA